ncbi:MAG: TonB-dependent receptor, partial [Proteobacteria bacterium]|nr:TonB-dependent receptor [Pseudomonadota bacterium]
PDYHDRWFSFERAYLGLTPCPAEDPSQRRGDNSLRRPYSVSGNQLPWSPKWSLTVNVEHNWWVGDGLRLSPYVSVSWTDEMFFDDRNFDEEPFHSGQEEVTTVNASLRLIDEGRRWGAELYVYNATDERVKSWVDPGGPGYVRANYFPPRTYGVKLRKDF